MSLLFLFFLFVLTFLSVSLLSHHFSSFFFFLFISHFSLCFSSISSFLSFLSSVSLFVSLFLFVSLLSLRFSLFSSLSFRCLLLTLLLISLIDHCFSFSLRFSSFFSLPSFLSGFAFLHCLLFQDKNGKNIFEFLYNNDGKKLSEIYYIFSSFIIAIFFWKCGS